MSQTVSPCQTCRSWKGCAGFAWYSLADIKFCRLQIYWLLPLLGELKEGIWPPNPDSSSYTDVPLGKGQRIRHEGKFCKPAEIAAEIELRGARTGKDGKILLYQVQAGYRMDELEYEARTALNYMAGWRRRKDPYRKWKHDVERGRTGYKIPTKSRILTPLA